jgi:hypothetical protein
MNFAPGGPGRREPAPTSAPRSAGLLLGCCALAAAATAFPWIRVRLSSLWGDFSGPIGMHTNAGFTCVTTCLLTALLVLAEGRTAPAREAVRTGCLLLMAAAGCTLAWRLWDGPGSLRGATAAHTGWFFLSAIAVAAGIVACRLRQQPRGSAA